VKIQFVKMTGAGNDFVLVDNRKGVIRDAPSFARSVCDRRWGVGADGILLMEQSRRATYRMMYYNADGSYGGMCGNGGRCIAFFAVESGIARSSHTFEALDYVYAVVVRDQERVQLSLKDPTGIRRNLRLRLGNRIVRADFVDTGAPHAVLFASSFLRGPDAIDRLDVMHLGRALRYHRSFSPSGANVNFIDVTDQGVVRMRTYERGVEDETLACGTGAVACSLVSHLRGKVTVPVTVETKSGKHLIVSFAEHSPGSFVNVILTGPVRITFRGIWEA